MIVSNGKLHVCVADEKALTNNSHTVIIRTINNTQEQAA